MAEIQYFWRHPLAMQVREEGRVEGRAEGFREGMAQERAATVLRILQLRQIRVPDEIRTRVRASRDMDELTSWLDRSYRVVDASELFVAE
ncbi:hypothetical protein [Streptomyces sp. MBT53]|uniref:hypothetical protein n=1 Tax=Streptomyces sp. MBT53 TaxID=1488384 RepID=UPI001913272A|nr:hypothetical protein [Streptomyces sp. MBT53]MBK6018798.1 hypothetical protein [Streptomyces sp. MBT53]